MGLLGSAPPSLEVRRQHRNVLGRGSASGVMRCGWSKFVLPCLTSFVAGCLVTMSLIQQQQQVTTGGSIIRISGNGSGSDCVVSLGPYKGPHYVHPTQTVRGRGRCLVESKFVKVQQHSVQFPPVSTAADKSLLPPRIDDWLWIDYHDRINVLVEAAPAAVPPSTEHSTTLQQQPQSMHDEPHFLIFQQTKYALEGRHSLAIVGGIVEPGEDPAAAARREVTEEMALDCARYQSLGRYRTDVNRGMGWTHAYLAQDCNKISTSNHPKEANQPPPPSSGDSTASAVDEVGVADTERQDLQIMSLSEVRKAVQNGEFLEIQWSATVALAILYYEHRKDGG